MGIRIVPRRERPGYDPASGMSVMEYNNRYDREFPSGDPGMLIQNPYMKGPLSGGESPIIANQRNIRSDPNATMIPLSNENPEAYAYPNGGRSLPYVGNSWWQANEPIFPWNRKDWTEKSAGYAKSIGDFFGNEPTRDYTFGVDGNTEAYSFSGDALTPEAVQAMRDREGITPVRVENTYNPDPYFQVTGRPVSSEEVPMIRYSPTPVPSGDVPVNNLDNWWKVNTSF